MKIAMAAPYDIKNPRTWSGTPCSLYNGLCDIKDNTIDTINLSEYHTDSLKKKNLFSHIDLKRTIKEKHPISKLGPSVMNPLNSKLLNNICKEKDYDVLIEFGGFQPGENLPPYYIYTDSSHDMVLDYYSLHGYLPYNNSYSLKEMRAAAEYARPIFQNAAGVFCMSDYLAESMIKTSGVSREKVHTVYAGANWHCVDLPVVQKKNIDGKEIINILLIGVDYIGKGADIAVEAMKILHKKYGDKFRLHLCGIREEIPNEDYIINHGFVDKNKLIEILGGCDLFVLPSRFDCFGISFVEAMTFGLPCIGRKICAMPEIIDEGINGELIVDDDPEKLAALIEKICYDSERYNAYSSNAIEKAKKFTWKNVCSDIMKVIEADIKK